MDSDVRTRARVAEHWHASERGDIEAEHNLLWVLMITSARLVAFR